MINAAGVFTSKDAKSRKPRKEFVGLTKFEIF